MEKYNRFCLIGNPLGHSISPVIHNYLARKTGHDITYSLMDTPKEELDTVINGLSDNKIGGVNVTIPYKTDVIKYLTRADDAVKTIGACNTIVARDGVLSGYNTDYLGLMRELEDYGIDLQGKKVAILGAGGASKAVRYLCDIKHASEIVQFNRTAKEGVLPLCDASALSERGFDIVFQSTSVGMYPNNNDCIIDDGPFFDNSDIGIDIVYNPLQTAFMSRLEQRGKKAHNGLRMLLYQGVEAFKLFNEIESIDPVIEKDCFLNMLLGMNHVLVLCGMMGCGKTTIGKRISEDNNCTFIDTDEFIVKKIGMSINDIFAQKGEAAFRQMEYDALEEILATTSNDPGNKYVISLGGGMCTPVNMKLIRSLGATVYLRQDAAVLAKRLSGKDDRPLLKDKDTFDTVKQLLDKRESLYMEAADEIVDY